jgi:hypothetical protein
MEDDRAQVDLGVAVDVEERVEEEAQKLPKRRSWGGGKQQKQRQMAKQMDLSRAKAQSEV